MATAVCDPLCGSTPIDHLADRGRSLLIAWKRAAHPVELVRYEDLVREPEPTLRRVLDFADLDASRATVGRMLAAAHRETPESEFGYDAGH